MDTPHVSEPSDPTAERILTAAWDLLVTSMGWIRESGAPAPPLKLFDHVKATDVVRRARLSTGAFYNRWPDRESFIEGLLDFALSSERAKIIGETVNTAIAEARRGGTLRRLIEATTQADLDAILGDPAFAVQMYLWSSCRARDEVRSRLRNLYDEFSSYWQQVYRLALDEYGLILREPFTIQYVDAIFSALAQGLVIQHAIGRDLPSELFTWSILALVLVVATEPGDTRSLFDLWEQFGADSGRHDRFLQAEPIEPTIRTPSARLRERRHHLRAVIAELSELEKDLSTMLDQDET